MKTLIFANGSFDCRTAFAHLVEMADLIIAADGGAVHCAALGIQPHVALGDFDSIGRELLDHYEQEGVELYRHPVHKDATDLELALDLAGEKGAEQVYLLGALGGRWDMSIANIMLAAQEKYCNIEVSLVDGDCLMRILHPGREHTVVHRDGIMVSLLPLGGDVVGVTLTGFRYPLAEQTIRFGSSRGVSNLLETESGSIRHQNGILLCIQQAAEEKLHSGK
jgi:thiamine pyrophosphokinase